MATPTQAQIASQMSALLDRWATFSKQLQDWLAGVADGGTYGDGRYPLTDSVGTVYYVACPAAQDARVSTTVDSAGSYANAAQTSADAAAEARAATDQAMQILQGYMTDTQSARDLAQTYADTAGSHSANARAAADEAKTSSDSAAESLATINQVLGDATTQAVADATASAQASAAAAAGSRDQAAASAASMDQSVADAQTAAGAAEASANAAKASEDAAAGSAANASDSAAEAQSWAQSAAPKVTSVAGRTGDVALAMGDVAGLTDAVNAKADKNQPNGATLAQWAGGARIYAGPGGGTVFIGTTYVGATLLQVADVNSVTKLSMASDGTLTLTAPMVVDMSGASTYEAKFIQPGSSPAGSYVSITSPGSNPGIIGMYSTTKRRDIHFSNTGIQFAVSSGSAGTGAQFTFGEDGSFTSQGLALGSTVVTTKSDLGKHLALYGASWGISMTSGFMNFVSGSAGRYDFVVNGTTVRRVESDGTTSIKNANSTTLTNQPRLFVQSADPGAAASDGDLWGW